MFVQNKRWKKELKNKNNKTGIGDVVPMMPCLSPVTQATKRWEGFRSYSKSWNHYLPHNNNDDNTIVIIMLPEQKITCCHLFY